MDDEEKVKELEATVRSLREEIERLKKGLGTGEAAAPAPAPPAPAH